MNLLKRLLPAEDVDALLGDIAEEARHRSRLWYWSQLLAVVVVASWKDIRAHKWMAVRATITGMLTLGVFYAPASLAVWTVRVLTEGGYYIGPVWLTLPHAALIVTPFLFNATAFLLSGWIVARFHREHGLAMVLPYLAMSCILPAMAVVRMLAIGPGVRSFELPMFVSIVLAIASLPLWVIVGAILGARKA